ncbi:hypothetical protein MTO96_027863 [Rhipicephalus appendiculatus]
MATSAWRTRAGNLSPSDDESASDEDVVVVFDSSSEEDSDDVLTGSDSEEEESSDDTMASAREWYRIDQDLVQVVQEGSLRSAVLRTLSH